MPSALRGDSSPSLGPCVRNSDFLNDFHTSLLFSFSVSAGVGVRADEQSPANGEVRVAGGVSGLGGALRSHRVSFSRRCRFSAEYSESSVERSEKAVSTFPTFRSSTVEWSGVWPAALSSRSRAVSAHTR